MRCGAHHWLSDPGCFFFLCLGYILQCCFYISMLCVHTLCARCVCMYVYKHIERHAHLHLETERKNPLNSNPKPVWYSSKRPPEWGRQSKGRRGDANISHPLPRSGLFFFMSYGMWYGMVWYADKYTSWAPGDARLGLGLGLGSNRIEDGVAE